MARSIKPHEINGISEISVAGLKSIGKKQAIEIRPLTILAGTNSSGKSSMMQGLLLLKQTLEAPYNPGPLLLNGPNLKFTETDQLFSKNSGTKHLELLEIGLGLMDGQGLELRFRQAARDFGKPVEIDSQWSRFAGKSFELRPQMPWIEAYSEITKVSPGSHPDVPPAECDEYYLGEERCFLSALLKFKSTSEKNGTIIDAVGWRGSLNFEPYLTDAIHVLGIRGNRERYYPLTPITDRFSGTFDFYFASVLADWTRHSAPQIDALSAQLIHLGLTWRAEAHAIDAVHIEVLVGRLSKAKSKTSKDLVNVADVGLGVSHLLPVLVALLVAKPGQLVYVEQPEIHLHPRAQSALSNAFVEAANRGVRVVVETHSSLFLLGVQSLVAEGKLAPDKVKLHWFSRSNQSGETRVSSSDLDEAGRFGEWPEDFDDVLLESQRRYLDAVEAKLASRL